MRPSSLSSSLLKLCTDVSNTFQNAQAQCGTCSILGGSAGADNHQFRRCDAGYFTKQNALSAPGIARYSLAMVMAVEPAIWLI